jgi:hypothetical protein
VRFAEILRAMRHTVRLSYEDLAVLTNYSSAQLKRAGGGEWPACTGACGWLTCAPTPR